MFQVAIFSAVTGGQLACRLSLLLQGLVEDEEVELVGQEKARIPCDKDGLSFPPLATETIPTGLHLRECSRSIGAVPLQVWATG